ncbi:conserved hypothetical protein [Candidatus Terasakiella magnetica]|uniref:Methyltransferase n=1 Tax=Candidatus Terasakiella magnetica TaxID=1867952 RepID=A0A1C3RGC5_9PROT|nr:class I SAM-dependent methyltransferase [Candidatus Terasakiella magnetica]SCA56252.1 conserved hypothetical protein [Candidatus Terasakiella magnetica]
MTSYDEAVYLSYFYQQSNPEQFNGLAHIHGLKPADLSRARILELGCATGSNILPLAVRYPEASFLGIDLSPVQIEIAQNHCEGLGLKNIDFVAQSFAEYDFGDQKFDYIIAHGLYSWIPKNLQDDVMRVCAHCLSDQGVTYINYNTYPGWQAAKTVRDMLLFHTKEAVEPAQKAKQAKQVAGFVKDHIKPEHAPYRQALEPDLNGVLKAEDNYLLHDYMEEDNNPCYFHEFATKAEENGLQYLCDTEFASSVSQEVQNQITQVLGNQGDRVNYEQYGDYLNNRKFRSSLMVKAGVEPVQALKIEHLKNVRFIMNCKITTPIHPDQIGKMTQISIEGFKRYNIKASPQGLVICTALIEMVRAFPLRLNYEELVERTHGLLGTIAVEAIKAELDGILIEMVKMGIVSVMANEDQSQSVLTIKPKAYDFVRYWAQHSDIVCNIHHEAVKLSEHEDKLLALMDGSFSVDELGEKMKPYLGQPDEMVQQWVGAKLQRFLLCALISA